MAVVFWYYSCAVGNTLVAAVYLLSWLQCHLGARLQRPIERQEWRETQRRDETIQKQVAYNDRNVPVLKCYCKPPWIRASAKCLEIGETNEKSM